MKALKFLKHMKQTDTPYNFRECEINEAIEELEEAMNLTRREWYQKGFNEAMKTKTCSSCYWWNDFYAKCNDHDNSLAGFGDYGCNRYEPKVTP